MSQEKQETQDKFDLSAVPSRIQQPARRLGEILLELGGEGLEALVVFGAALTDEFDPKRMRIQSVAVLGRMDLAMLNELRSKGVKLGKAGLQAPLIMTPQYIESSRDAFPIELLEIQQLHATIHGRECFDELKFSPADMRLQCERELKRSLIQLRQGLLGSAGRDKVLADLCLAASEHAVRILRAILWLKHQAAPKPARRVIEAARSVVEMQLNGLIAVAVANVPGDFARFEALYQDTEALAHWVDKLEI